MLHDTYTEDVCREALYQLSGTRKTGRLHAMLGGKDFVFELLEGRGRTVQLSFKFTPKNKIRANFCRIIYHKNDPKVSFIVDDMYTMELCKRSGGYISQKTFEWVEITDKIIKSYQGIQGDDLERIFREATGLDTHMGGTRR